MPCKKTLKESEYIYKMYIKIYISKYMVHKIVNKILS